MQRRAEEVHSVGFEQLVQAFEPERFVNGGIAVEFADFAEEFFDAAGGLVDIQDSPVLLARASPDVRHVSRDEDAFAAGKLKLLIADVKFEFAVENVDPLVLLVMQMLR